MKTKKLSAELENKVLIADFLEWRKFDTNYVDELRSTLQPYLVNPSYLPFKSDWNYLMLAVEKIRIFHNGTYPLNDKQIGELIELIKELNKSLTLRNSVSITSVYNAVVEFIKWYNLNK